MAGNTSTAEAEYDPIYHERESKTDAGSSEDLPKVRGEFLDKVRNHIIRDPDGHYISPNNRRFVQEHLRDLPFEDELKSKSIGYRVNYDTLNLDLYKAGVEIRVEKKTKLDKKAGLIRPVYVMTVKVGESTADRLEVEAELPGPKPDLDQLKAGFVKILKKSLGTKNLSKLDLRPMSQIVVQSWKTPFHPDGDLETRIEHKNDRGRLTTIFGQTHDIFQTEQEVIMGDQSYLLRGRQRLLDKFNFLSPTERSKPTEGYLMMEPLLEDKKLRKALAKVVPEYTDPMDFEPYYPLSDSNEDAEKKEELAYRAA